MEFYVMTSGRTQGIMVKIWNHKIQQLDMKLQDRIRISNLTVHTFKERNSLNSTDETAVEVRRYYILFACNFNESIYIFASTTRFIFSPSNVYAWIYILTAAIQKREGNVP